MANLGADSVVAPHFAAFLLLRRAIYTRTSCDMLKLDHSLSLGPQLAKCFDFHFSSDQYVAFFSLSSISTDWDNQASLWSARRLHLDILLLWPVKRSYEIVGFGHCHCHYCTLIVNSVYAARSIYRRLYSSFNHKVPQSSLGNTLNRGKSQEDGIHHDVGLHDFVCFTFLCGIWHLFIQITYPNDSPKRVFGRLQLLAFIAEFSLNPFLLCLWLPEIRAEAVKQLNTQTILPINLHPEN